ncbi:MAG: SPOR domain-containing protein [Fusobacteriota bacterium]
MRISKKRVVFVKLLILIGFIYTCFYFYDKLTLKISKLRTQKKIETNNIIDNLNIRTKDFYIKAPENKLDKNNLTLENKNKLKEKKPDSIKNTNINTNTNKTNYYIQIGTYSEKENALKRINELKNYNAKIEKKTINNIVYNQVVITEIQSRNEANEILSKIPNSENYLIRVRY